MFTYYLNEIFNSMHEHAYHITVYYPTALRIVQIMLKTSTNITRHLYSREPARQVSCH